MANISIVKKDDCMNYGVVETLEEAIKDIKNGELNANFMHIITDDGSYTCGIRNRRELVGILQFESVRIIED